MVQYVGDDHELISCAFGGEQVCCSGTQEAHAGAIAKAQPTWVSAEIDTGQHRARKGAGKALGYCALSAADLEHVQGRGHMSMDRVDQGIKIDEYPPIRLGDSPLLPPESPS